MPVGQGHAISLLKGQAERGFDGVISTTNDENILVAIVIGQKERSGMEHHLAEGCTGCARLKALMEGLYHQASNEPLVPPGLVDAAKAVFLSREPCQVPSWLGLPRLDAGLVFNSVSAAAHGVRGLTDGTVQVVYHAGDYAIELQLEREPDSPEFALVGQVVNRAAAGVPLRGAAVLAMLRHRVVSTVETNRFGEFWMALKLHRGTTLCMHIEEIGRRVEIPLSRVLAGRG